MSQRQPLRKGDYAYSNHSLQVSGNIADVFVGRWIIKDDHTRILQKFPPEEEIEQGQLMCFLKLKKPLPLDEYREIHHPDLRPMVQSLSDDVTMVLMPAEMVCTFPDGM